MRVDTGEFTRLLRESSAGNKEALDRLMPLVYEQLHLLAARSLRSERPGHTLQATALVHEAYLRLAGAEVEWADRTHFLAVASGVMRRLLVDHARARSRAKRGSGAVKVTWDAGMEVSGDRGEELVAVDEALAELAKVDERKSRLLEMIYFGGLTQTEAASAAGISERTLSRELVLAKAWVRRYLS
jgi:RNA polymerase sigma factor (TIGR02999 family)